MKIMHLEQDGLSALELMIALGKEATPLVMESRILI